LVFEATRKRKGPASAGEVLRKQRKRRQVKRTKAVVPTGGVVLGILTSRRGKRLKKGKHLEMDGVVEARRAAATRRDERRSPCRRGGTQCVRFMSWQQEKKEKIGGGKREKYSIDPESGHNHLGKVWTLPVMGQRTSSKRKRHSP